MSSIFHGGNTYIFYNADANNNIPTSVTYKIIDELGAFPQVKINSSTTSIETYNDEWVQVLSGNMSIDSVSIVVHYLADNESHQYLDGAFTNQTNFQIKVSLYESQDSLDQHYVILNGYISGFSDSGDQNEVYSRTYTFTAEDVISRGTAQDPANLRIGDFGVGANGETYPQYESATPAGNSFIKVPALREDNPIGGDLGGFAFVDNGGDKTAQLAIPSDGNLGIYIKNTDNDWLSIPLKSTNDGLYVPLTRTINGKVLSSNITLSKTDIGLSAVTNDAQLKIASNLSDLANVATARTNLNVYSKAEADATTSTLVPKTTTVNGHALSGNVSVTAGDVGLGNVLNAVQLVASNNLSDLANEATARTNLNVYSKAEAVPSTLTVNGKALSTNIILTSSDTGSFSIANNLSEGVPATIRTNIGAAKSGVNADITGLTGLSGPLRLGGDAASDYDAVTLKQLLANAGGGTGATLNGVMNNFLGAVEWFNGTRAKLPAGHAAADGQLLNRADYPDLWNAISTGVLNSVTEALWQNSGVTTNVASNRGMYSTGNGTTTFRMPDLNGSQSGSTPNLYLRGTGTGVSGIPAGTTSESALPNLTGQMSLHGGQVASIISAVNGVFAGGGGGTTYRTPVSLPESTGASSFGRLDFDSSKSNSVYGRDGVGEARPRSAWGIWLIRVNGLYSAANSIFNVITADTSLPATGTAVYGGGLRSDYKVGSANYVSTTLTSRSIIGNEISARLDIIDNSGSSENRTAFTFKHGATGGGLGGDITCLSGELGLYSSGGATLRLRADGSVRINNSPGTSAIEVYGSGIGITGNVSIEGRTLSQFYTGGSYASDYSREAPYFINAGISLPTSTYVPFVKSQISSGSWTSRISYGCTTPTTSGLPTATIHMVASVAANGQNSVSFSGDGSITTTGKGAVTFATSDMNWKNKTNNVIQEEAYKRISQLTPLEFTWKPKVTDTEEYPEKLRRGFFAQDAFAIDESYAVKPTEVEESQGIPWALEDRAIMADMVATIQLMSTQIANLQSQIDTFKPGTTQ